MPSDAFIVGEDWISEHYFNTESAKQTFQGRVIARRKDWDERESAGEKSPRSRLAAAGAALTSLLSNVDTDADGDAMIEVDAGRHRSEVLAPLAAALGYEDARWRRETNGPITLLAPKDATEASAALVFARPVADVVDLLSKNKPTLLDPFLPEDATDEVVSVARALSWLFTNDDAPAFAVVLSGAKALVVERERWAEGRYLAVDLQLVLDRNEVKKRGGEFDRAVAALAAESVSPDVDGTTWWTETLDDSVKHTVGVSKDLRDGVRESIEIIANEVVRRRAAQGLDPLPASEANTLARQSLRYLYRVLFLLFAEASPELRVLPVGAPEYALGYGLDRLRELVLVELGEESRHRTHLHESLDTLFRLVDAGHEKSTATDEAELPEGLEFHPLSADLFRRESVALIDAARLGDGALQRVLALLLLTREERTKKGGDRGFISYADLGINQLGAVYEGLMSYSGFFAETDLFEVAKDGDSSKGSWVVPVERAHDIAKQHFVMAEDPITHERVQRRYRGGEFVFRLSGRERQTSASYYSPEVLTKFVVGQALAELLDQDGHTTSAEEILSLSVCEPALGSGAFAIEAVRQLADEYLSRREREVGERIDPDERPRELQKAKAAIALHQVYGVDLNATAVELAEISLWLDTMVDGLQAPWFGLRLRRGNSLIGARRAVYSSKQVTDKAWLKDVPTDVPVASLVDDMREGRIGSATSGRVHHFLLPAEGWGAAVDAKEGKELTPEAHAKLRAWRNEMRRKPSKKQLDRLLGLSHRVEVLWQFTLRRLEIAESQVRREVTLWNDPRDAHEPAAAITRDDIERFLKDPNGAYQRLRRVMDAWCAMWFWPLTDSLTDGAAPPTFDEWLDGLTALLGVHAEVKAPKRASEGAQTLGLPTNWHDLDAAEAVELGFAQVESVDETLGAHAWLRASERIADANGFFHWELDFAGVFAKGGFDLQVGNPPWVRPDFDEAGCLAEFDVWWALNLTPDAREATPRRAEVLADRDNREAFLNELTLVESTRVMVSSPTRFPALAGLRPDLYRCFMEQCWRISHATGVIGLIHQESHFTDERGRRLRSQTYRRLRRHWQFINELKLFEIQHQKRFGVSVYGCILQSPSFKHAAFVYHPDTIVKSLVHDGSGPVPGMREISGTWDLRAHADRISTVDKSTLRAWAAISEFDDWESTPMVSVANQSSERLLLAAVSSTRVNDLDPSFSLGWNETAERRAGRIEKIWGNAQWKKAIVQGPHLHVNTPYYKHPNESMRHQTDWSVVDFESLSADEELITAYKPVHTQELDNSFPHWITSEGRRSSRNYHRVVWRSMLDNVAERTLVSAIIPPGPGYLSQSIYGLGFPEEITRLPIVAGYMSSMIADFMIRASPKSSAPASAIRRLPQRIGSRFAPLIALRALRLNCITTEYGDLWSKCFMPLYSLDAWAPSSNDLQTTPLGCSSAAWSPDVPLRIPSDRRKAQLEIDVLVALSLDINIDDLVALYSTQFPVLFAYDKGLGRKGSYYDANGRLVPNEVLKVWRQKGVAIAQEERTATNASGNTYEYELPFVTLDREADMRQAYAHFEKILQEHS